MMPAIRSPRFLIAILAVVVTVLGASSEATAEQASSNVNSLQSGRIDAGYNHACAIIADGTVRCWGEGSTGRLGYGNTTDIGDDEAPASAGPVDLGAGAPRPRSRRDIVTPARCSTTPRCAAGGMASAASFGYGRPQTTSATTKTPAAAGPVDLGAGRTAVAISAGAGAHLRAARRRHRAAAGARVVSGQLGYGNVDQDRRRRDACRGRAGGPRRRPHRGGDRRRRYAHLCPSSTTPRCAVGALVITAGFGYGNLDTIGDDETPGSVGTVDLGAGRTAVAISAESQHTCALPRRRYGALLGSRVPEASSATPAPQTSATTRPPPPSARWTSGAGRHARSRSQREFMAPVRCSTTPPCAAGARRGDGALGYGNTTHIGDDETPGSVGPVELGAGRTAIAITMGEHPACALLDDGTLRCWGWQLLRRARLRQLRHDRR